VGKGLEYLRSGFRPRQVAAMTGFCDQAQMTRTFRQELGFTPAHFQRATLAPEGEQQRHRAALSDLAQIC
jgi:AraC-like DNA-binding protein